MLKNCDIIAACSVLSIAVFRHNVVDMEETKINKDLILREKLAIERTIMANQRTFLSFLRTALYFFIAGISINELLVLKHGTIIVVVFFLISFLLLISGTINYLKQKKKITNSKKQVGGQVNIKEDL